jgi:hypothetical protein
MLHQSLEVNGEEVTLKNTYDTDPYEEAAEGRKRDNGMGFIKGKRGGGVWGRVALDIPLIDMMMLETQKDQDWLEYDRTGNRNALTRLLLRFPYWKICDGRM